MCRRSVMTLRSRERPPPEKAEALDTAPSLATRFMRAVVAAAGAIAAAAIWLCLLDRVGVVLVGGNAWCGPRGLWLLYACHAAVAAPVVVAFFAFRALTAVVPRGGRIVIPVVGAVTGFVALWILFVDWPAVLARWQARRRGPAAVPEFAGEFPARGSPVPRGAGDTVS